MSNLLIDMAQVVSSSLSASIVRSATSTLGNTLPAYIGPGAGLGMIGSLIAVACVLGLALIAPLLYPIRLFIRWRKRRKGELAPDTAAAQEKPSGGAESSG